MDLQRQVKYRDYRLVLAAGVPQVIDAPGDYWQLVETPGGSVSIELDDSVTLTRAAPCGGPGNYRRAVFTSSTAQTIIVALGYTNGLVPYDNRMVTYSGLEIIERVPESVAGLADLAIAAGASSSFAANLSRDSIVVSLDDAAPGYVLIASGAAGVGVRLYPGGSITIRTTAAVQVFNPNAVAVTVSATQTVLV